MPTTGLARLEEMDRRVGGRWLSLAPDRERAAPLVGIARSIARARSPVDDAWCESLARIAGAVLEHFPDNIFCDLEVIAAWLRMTALRVEEPEAWLAGATERMVTLHALYGRYTVIRFRYVHDFLYGFDWARWVQRDPATRARVGPFDAAFLEHSARRARELIMAIERGDDPKYPPLPAGAIARNPFGFSREPEDEKRLLRALAREGWIPLEAWRTQPGPAWDRPYQETRERRARELGATGIAAS